VSILLFNGSFLHSQDTQLTIRDYSTGLIDINDPAEIPDGAAQSLQNVDLWSGKVEKRRGSIKQNDSAIDGNTNPVQLIHEFIDNNDTFHMIFAINGTIYRSANGGATSEVLASSFGFTSASQYQATTAFGLARLTDGTTHWLTYDGTSVIQDTISVQGKLAEFYSERVWTADVTGDRSTLFASRFQDVTDWTANDTDDGEALSTPIRKEDGYPVRALKRFKDALIVFKDTSMHRIQVLSDGLTFVIEPISTTIGTQYPTSIQVDKRGLIFLFTTGFYLYDGVQLIKISDPIHNTFFSINQLNRSEESLEITTSADFSSGTITTSLSTSAINGSVTYTTSTLIDDFSDGDFDNNPTWNRVNGIGGNLPDTEIVVSGHFLQNWAVVTSSIIYVRKASTTFVNREGTWIYSIRSDIAPTCGSQSDTQHGVGFYISETVTSFNSPSLTTFGEGSSSTQDLRTISVQLCPEVVRLWGGTSPLSGEQTPTVDIFDGSFHTVALGYNQASNLATLSLDGIVQISETPLNVAAQPLDFEFTGTIVKNPPEQVNFRFDDVNYDFMNGIYQSQPHDMGVEAVDWSTYENTFTVDGTTLTFAIYADSDTQIDTGNSSTFGSSQTITNGQTPVIDFERFVTLTSSFTRDSSIFTGSVQDIKISWLTGAGVLVPASIEYQDDYMCAVAIDSTTANDTILVFDRNNRWTKYKQLTANSMLKFREKPYFGSQEGDTNIFRFQVDNIYQDDGEGIQSKWRSKEFDFGFPATDKTIVRYYITAERVDNSEATFEYFVNRATSGATVILDLDKDLGAHFTFIQPPDLNFKRGRTHSFEIQSTAIDDYFKIFTITIVPRLETAP